MAKREAQTALMARIGYHFTNEDLLAQALLHDSMNKNRNNEHLEFLGDRVLGMVIAEMLVQRFPHEPEGHLARRLAVLVSRDTCAMIAEQWQLGKVLQVGGGRGRNVIADGCEAVLGAIYLDGGLDAARKTILTHWDSVLRAQVEVPLDAKTELQEYAMKQKFNLPVYETIKRQGRDHAPQFSVRVMVADLSAQGEGKSVRAAERAAAQAWLAQYRDKTNA